MFHIHLVLVSTDCINGGLLTAGISQIQTKVTSQLAGIPRGQGRQQHQLFLHFPDEKELFLSASSLTHIFFLLLSEHLICCPGKKNVKLYRRLYYPEAAAERKFGAQDVYLGTAPVRGRGESRTGQRELCSRDAGLTRPWIT